MASVDRTLGGQAFLGAVATLLSGHAAGPGRWRATQRTTVRPGRPTSRLRASPSPAQDPTRPTGRHRQRRSLPPPERPANRPLQPATNTRPPGTHSQPPPRSQKEQTRCTGVRALCERCLVRRVRRRYRDPVEGFGRYQLVPPRTLCIWSVRVLCARIGLRVAAVCTTGAPASFSSSSWHGSTANCGGSTQPARSCRRWRIDLARERRSRLGWPSRARAVRAALRAARRGDAASRTADRPQDRVPEVDGVEELIAFRVVVKGREAHTLCCYARQSHRRCPAVRRSLPPRALDWAASEMCRQSRLIWPPSFGHRRRSLRGCAQV